MNIRCRIGLHKWTVFNKIYFTGWGGRQFVDLQIGCLRCGKVKVKKGVPVNE